MFEIAFFLGIVSYSIFFLGVFHLLYTSILLPFSCIALGLLILVTRKKIIAASISVRNLFKKSAGTKFLLLLIAVQILVNGIGVFGPEISFDALWYHLTLPKLFLQWHAVEHIPGGLLYYSDMPKLIEMLYVAALSFGNDSLARSIHLALGVATTISIYFLGRKYLSQKLSLMAAILFYSNLVVGWESVSAYIDLGRAFFEVLTFYFLIEWEEKTQIKFLFFSSLLLGFAISTKFIAFTSLGIFIPLIVFILFLQKKSIGEIVGYCVGFIAIACIIPSPWWIFSYLNTGNFFYPFFSPIYPTDHLGQLNLLLIFTTLKNTFLFSPDPISPLYAGLLPFVFLIKKWSLKIKLLAGYTILSLIIWYFSPQTGGGRFLLAYLPVYSVLVVIVYDAFPKGFIKKIILFIFFLLALSSIGYRFLANAKFIPVILGRETKQAFLGKELHFDFGDFADIDGYFKTHIKNSDKVLIYGYHNLYYVNFSFVHESWAKKGDSFNYILSNTDTIPKRFSLFKLVYKNSVTHAYLFSDN
ncbi:MAG TPA: glycosyltransferase family 39 protein, partial [Patescibacteria group bacterium]